MSSDTLSPLPFFVDFVLEDLPDGSTQSIGSIIFLILVQQTILPLGSPDTSSYTRPGGKANEPQTIPSLGSRQCKIYHPRGWNVVLDSLNPSQESSSYHPADWKNDNPLSFFQLGKSLDPGTLGTKVHLDYTNARSTDREMYYFRLLDNKKLPVQLKGPEGKRVAILHTFRHYIVEISVGNPSGPKYYLGINLTEFYFVRIELLLNDAGNWIRVHYTKQA